MTSKHSVFVGNLPFDTVPSDLENMFHGLSVNAVRLVHDRDTNKFKGFAYVEFSEEEDATRALEANGIDLNGNQVKVDLPRQRTDQRTPRSDEIPTEGPFVGYLGGFPAGMSDNDIKTKLCDGLNVESVRVLGDKCVAFVDFSDRESLKLFLELNNEEVDGHALKCNVAKSRKPAPQSRIEPTERRRTEFVEPKITEGVIKLNLAPRTKPLEQIGKAQDKPSGKADPFGGAKPRDEFAYQKRKTEKTTPKA